MASFAGYDHQMIFIIVTLIFLATPILLARRGYDQVKFLLVELALCLAAAAVHFALPTAITGAIGVFAIAWAAVAVLWLGGVMIVRRWPSMS